MFRVGSKKIGQVGNRNHTYISFKPNGKTFRFKKKLCFTPTLFIMALLLIAPSSPAKAQINKQKISVKLLIFS